MLNLPFTRSINKSSQALGLQKGASGEKASSLAKASTGKRVTIREFGTLSAAHKQHLQAYGLLPGRTIQVLAQQPVTIVLVEQTELAFEKEIAAQILVD